jgi:hypothetical protein
MTPKSLKSIYVSKENSSSPQPTLKEQKSFFKEAPELEESPSPKLLKPKKKKIIK